MEWSAIIPNIVGGVITAGTAALLFWLSKRNDRVEKATEKKRREARFALIAFNKLLYAAENTINLARSLDEEFQEAREQSINHESELHDHVRPIMGSGYEGEVISIEEAYFLAKGDRFSIFSDSNVFIRRAKLNSLMLDRYNAEKQRYNDFLESVPSGDVEVSSTGIARTIQGEHILRATAFTGKLNNLIGLLIEALERDKDECKLLVERFLLAAREEFGDDFPVKKLEWRD